MGPDTRPQVSRGEGLQCTALSTFPQTTQGTIPKLADSLARHAKHVAYFLQRMFPLAFETKVQTKNFRISWLKSLKSIRDGFR